ncbi:MAG: hypothetical protein FJ290_28035 [Planctomycetes bacterium]|nr:hypothetical protein [Planctomycetota bacterium]
MAPAVEDILDICIEESRRGGDPEVVLRQHAALAGEVRPLLAVARGLASLPAPEPSAHAVATLLAHLAVEGRGRVVGARRQRRFFLRPRALAAAAALLLAVVGWALVNASATAVPGDWLYPVKRLAERTGYALTISAQSRAEQRVAFADRRLKEAVLKHERGRGIDQELLRAMLDETVHALQAGSELSPTGRALLVRRIACSCQFHCDMLGELEARATPTERAALEPFVQACRARCACVQGAAGDECAEPASLASMADQLSRLVPPAQPAR